MNMIAISNAALPKAHELNYSERLVLHALRQWVQNRALWSKVVLEFNRTCGPSKATEICEALDRLFRELGTTARRNLRLHKPVSCRVSPDELCLLNLIAAHQAEAACHADGLMRWLVPYWEAQRIGDQCRQIARMLFDAGYTLEHRTGADHRPTKSTAPMLVLAKRYAVSPLLAPPSPEAIHP